MEDSYLVRLCVIVSLLGKSMGWCDVCSTPQWRILILSGCVSSFLCWGGVWDGVTLYVLLHNGGFLSSPVECVIVSLLGKSIGWCLIVRSTPQWRILIWPG